MRITLIAACLFLMQACKHPLAIEGEGYIIERLAGARGCTQEQFKAGAPSCSDNNVIESSYTVSYEAVPRPGWVFTGWEGTACAVVTDDGFCEYDVAQLWVDFTEMTWPGLAFPPTTAVFKLPEDAAVQVFEEEIEAPLLGARCLACHKERGLSGFTRLVFDHNKSSSQNATNIDAFRNFVDTVPDGREYILTKVRGGAGHGGGSIFSSGSNEWNSLADFLSLLQGKAPSDSAVSDTNFWDGVSLADARRTLRRAAIFIGGRLPTEAEYAVAESGEAGLREAILGLMQGSGFHDFLIQGANDRLLTDEALIGHLLFLPTPLEFPSWANLFADLYVEEGPDRAYVELGRVIWGHARSPTELIAWVVEQDLPYTEILTADYALLNPPLARALGVTIDFENPDSVAEFKPGRYSQLVDFGDSIVLEDINREVKRYVGGGELVQIPHAGVLTSYAFLERYPTTETNRNRARARWTYLHFLGVDIEKSAGRTIDPVALADTDNPTLKNPSCAVCHQLHDPVAGTFQNFGLNGLYRDAGGADALPFSYKYPMEFDPEAEPSAYVEGDTWFRGMRVPGFEGQVAPDNMSSLQWLADQITRDPRFSTAAVKFWWPAVMGAKVLEAPEILTDASYALKLEAFEAQQTMINALAAGFRGDYKLRELLADMLMSPWFRASSGTELSAARQLQLHGLGVERYLTPEQLERKIRVLTGYELEHYQPLDSSDVVTTRITEFFKLFLGGIDSEAVIERATTTNSIITNTVETIALRSACGIVASDFVRSEPDRVLFGGLDMQAIPVGDVASSDTANRTIVSVIQRLHEILLGEKLSIGDAELDSSYQLLLESRQDHFDNQSSEGLDGSDEHLCGFPGGWTFELIHDPEHMLKAWSAVLAYLLSDYRFVHE